MNDQIVAKNRRILIIDDNPSIHDAFRKILCPQEATGDNLEESEAALFGSPVSVAKQLSFEIDSAYQGQQGLELATAAVRDGHPYATAFVDIRMPPGYDGVETAVNIWNFDPELEIVICTAYSDYSWEDMTAKLGHSDRFLILKKPFEIEEVLQLANTLTEKWRLQQEAKLRFYELESLVEERTTDLGKTNERLEKEIVERKEREARIRKLSHAVEQSPASIVITNTQGLIEYVNPKFCAVTGYSMNEVRGQNPRLLKSGETPAEHYRELWATILAGREWHGELHNKKKSGELYWEFASISGVRDEDGQITHFVAVKEDITERKKTETEREHLVKSLEEALANVKSLSGLLPICADCKRIRDDKGYWSQVETYVSKHSDARFSHGLCPTCAGKFVAQLQSNAAELPDDLDRIR